MRRMMLIFMVLALSLGLGAGAWAAMYKVPKSICFQTGSNGDLITLTIKSMSSVKNGNGTMKMYNINGVYMYRVGVGLYLTFPMTGTGYIHPYWEWFHVTMTGAMNDTYHTWVFAAEVHAYYDENGNPAGFENVVVTGGYGLPPPPETTWGFYDTFSQTDCLGITFTQDLPHPRGAFLESLKARAAATKAASPPGQK